MTIIAAPKSQLESRAARLNRHDADPVLIEHDRDPDARILLTPLPGARSLRHARRPGRFDSLSRVSFNARDDLDEAQRSEDRPLAPQARAAHRTGLVLLIRGRFPKAKASAARVDELFALLKPGEDELAAIMRHAREIGQAIDGQLGEPQPSVRRRP